MRLVVDPSTVIFQRLLTLTFDAAHWPSDAPAAFEPGRGDGSESLRKMLIRLAHLKIFVLLMYY